jgi:nucleoside-diphosphate-sugar epimerase
MLRVLIVGFGDVAQRVALLLRGRAHVYALVRGAATRERAARAGAKAVAGDLDQLHQLRRIAGIADAVIHLAPPPTSARSADNSRSEAGSDSRTRHLLAALSRRESVARRFVYISTSGVYGDHAGARVTETSRLRAGNVRAVRRVDAQRRVRRWAARNQVRACVLRVPGIYAADRLPLQRLRSAQPALCAQDDVYTNHIHADDLAQIVLLALFRGRHNRVYIASDESELMMGEYFDRVADAYDLPRAPRVSRAEAQRVLPEASLSFMSESRRLSSERMRRELRVRLRYRTVADFLGRVDQSA